MGADCLAMHFCHNSQYFKFMKFKIKISGWSEGQRVSFHKTVECPDFVEHEVTFDSRYGPLEGRVITRSVLDQQGDWMYDNYDEIVVEECESRFIHPIEGFVILQPKLKSKKDEVLELATIICQDTSEEFKATFLGSLQLHWKDIKGLSPEKIVKIVLTTIDMATRHTKAVLDPITEALNSTSKLEG